MTTRFSETDNVTELIYQLVGAASTCWVGGTGDHQFDSTQAVVVADAAIERLIELGWAAPSDKPNHEEDGVMNLRLGPIGKLLAPGWGDCLRCHTPWKFVHYHTTSWGRTGCIALCEKCWSELTPQERLPFYRQLIEIWHTPPHHDPHGLTFDEEWALVEPVVLAGG